MTQRRKRGKTKRWTRQKTHAVSEPRSKLIDANGDVTLIVGNEATLVKLQVSSRTLTRISPVFRVMLSGQFAEGSRLKEKGSTDIILHDDDADAMLAIMRIISGCCHCHRRSNVRLLARIAVLCDKYQFSDERLLQAIYAWTGGILENPAWWSHGLQPQTITAMLCISWIFEMSVPFKEMTLILIEWDVELDWEWLPIPDTVREAAVNARKTFTTEICLANLEERLTSPYKKWKCTTRCENATVERMLRLKRIIGRKQGTFLPNLGNLDDLFGRSVLTAVITELGEYRCASGLDYHHMVYRYWVDPCVNKEVFDEAKVRLAKLDGLELKKLKKDYGPADGKICVDEYFTT